MILCFCNNNSDNTTDYCQLSDRAYLNMTYTLPLSISKKKVTALVKELTFFFQTMVDNVITDQPRIFKGPYRLKFTEIWTKKI